MSQVQVVNKPINFTIDGVSVTAHKGETILKCAERHGLYIPTLCYLPKLLPIASCRLCVVEVEGNNGFVLSCQTPAVDGIKVTTNSEKLQKERQNIMKLYDVNHPLECGVCDKSGECELQNKTLEFGVSSQEFSAKEQKRGLKKWGLVSYDESLCILCERCVHTCNEIIGDEALEIAVGGYKSYIRPKNSQTLDCTFCGECIAVCPVGALTSTNFKYTSNAWELDKVPSRCMHCSSACELSYEIKHSSTDCPADKIYRVSNDFANDSLCGAGRFGFDVEIKAQSDFERAYEAFEAADTIIFDSYTTNEEALILQKLKEKRGYKLINSDAKAYKEFLDAFSSASGNSIYSASLSDVKECDFAIVVGTNLTSDNPMVRYALTSAKKLRNAQIVNTHPIEEPLLKRLVNQHVRYEVGTEEGVLALIAKAFIKEQIGALSALDTGNLSAESNVGEEEITKLLKKANRAGKKVLILGADLYNHKRAKEIAIIAGSLERYAGFKVLIIPSQTNTLGVSQICELDSARGSYAIGYNTKADFELVMPPLSAQEGTFVDINKQVVPINMALNYGSYTLGCLANALGLPKKYTIEYTKELFSGVEFDNIPKDGYSLMSKKVEVRASISQVADLPEYNGTIVYLSNPVLQFGKYSATSKNLPKEVELVGSAQFAIAAKISDGSEIDLKIGNFSYKTRFKLDTIQKGTIATVSTFDKEELNSLYRYQKCEIIKRS